MLRMTWEDCGGPGCRVDARESARQTRQTSSVLVVEERVLVSAEELAEGCCQDACLASNVRFEVRGKSERSLVYAMMSRRASSVARSTRTVRVSRDYAVAVEECWN